MTCNTYNMTRPWKLLFHLATVNLPSLLSLRKVFGMFIWKCDIWVEILLCVLWRYIYAQVLWLHDGEIFEEKEPLQKPHLIY